MSAPPKQLPLDTDPEHVHKGTQALGGLGPMVFNLTMILWHWGQWRTVGVLAVMALLLGLTNMVFVEWCARWHSRTVAEWLRIVANTIGLCVGGHVTQWSPLVLIYLPYNLLWFYGLDAWVRPRLVMYVTVTSAFALRDGASPELLLALGMLGSFAYLLTEKRAALLRKALRQVLEQREQLERAHQQLQQVHERALAQEKFSSLGLMAAGVAHEINNPMSFVTSNVNSLYKDLQRQGSLPEPLKEYVEEVLPATLDGIRRVNAIVSDLRRFARGDAEAHSEYALNAEVQAALRIAHGQLTHCRMEVELGEVGRLMGRPQQIVQVLVNLLVNAGQATGLGGKVHLSTHHEGEGARVEIRDTGAGMSAETLRHLFQPFFTTKAPGEGMGLGLAVAHGIIESHGGRIEVESEPGKGTRFTVHLPRMPPQPMPPATLAAAPATGSLPAA
ncbi:MAG: histidine kinase [Myxococcaceae bacterium]|nr:histidine kinase [Myxococcaceae bacterium]